MSLNINQRLRLLAMGSHLIPLVWIPLILILYFPKLFLLVKAALDTSSIYVWSVSNFLFFLSFCAPIAFIFEALVALIGWLVLRKAHPFVKEQSVASLGFHGAIALYTLIISTIVAIFWSLVFALEINSCEYKSKYESPFACEAGPLGSMSLYFLFAMILGFTGLPFLLFKVSTIFFAATKALQGQSYRYPFTLRFLR